jgi:hypothetical protein
LAEIEATLTDNPRTLELLRHNRERCNDDLQRCQERAFLEPLQLR